MLLTWCAGAALLVAAGCVRLVRVAGGSTTSSGGAQATAPGATGGSSSTGGSSGASSGTATASTTGGPVCPTAACPDLWWEPCDVELQDCPPGKKCSLTSDSPGLPWEVFGCVPLDPDPKPIGEPCIIQEHRFSGLDDCETGAMCWSRDFGLEGICRGFCSDWADPSCPEPDMVCEYSAGSGLPFLCLPGCDPLLQDCEEGWLCLPHSWQPVFYCVIDASGGVQPPGAPCEFVNACGPGLLCASSEKIPGCDSLGCCTPYCDLLDPGADQACADLHGDPTVTCAPFYPMGGAPPGLESLGLCLTDP